MKTDMPLVWARITTIRRVAVLCLSILLAGACLSVRAQTGRLERERGRVMLNSIKNELKSKYYDPSFHGLDLDARFKQAEEKIKEANSISQIFGIIGQAVADLDDSHTRFIPPARASRTDYGWQMQMVGQKCYVIAVRPGSDAEAKGLKTGDQIFSINGYEPTRDNLWKVQYAYYSLRPQPSIELVVQSPGGQSRQLEIASKVTTGKMLLRGDMDIYDMIRESESEARLHRHRYYGDSSDVFIWKMPQFDLSDREVDDIMGNIAKSKTLILDLRGNGGGHVTTLKRMIGNVFDQDIKIGDMKRRNETKSLIAKTRGDKTFKGQLIVLVDSRSASASEIFARVVQLEKRGRVIGDRTAGAVMVSRVYQHHTGVDQIAYYGVSVTDADILMTDGQSLEHVGVVPDQLLLPSASNLASQRDPVLFRAATLAGLNIEPEKIGALFPIEWSK